MRENDVHKTLKCPHEGMTNASRSLFQRHAPALVHSHRSRFEQECITCARFSASYFRVDAFSRHCLTKRHAYLN